MGLRNLKDGKVAQREFNKAGLMEYLKNQQQVKRTVVDEQLNSNEDASESPSSSN
jgi:hypothetical protein